ncbi:MAG TPA: hypothetical protein VGC92_01385 [Phenylobacterium sp.]|jgi:hypothetical protein
MNRPLILIPCGGRKLALPARARDLYTGPYFRQALAWARTLGGRFLILSAKHGLVEPEERIEPYDLRMGQPGSVTAGLVHAQAHARGLLDEPCVLAAGGRAYLKVVRDVWPLAETPFEGLGLGKQLQAMRRAIERSQQ